MNSVFVDTNVWVDVVLKRPAFYDDSMGCLLACIEEGIDVYVAGTSLKDVFYWARKSAGLQAGYRAVSLLLGVATVACVDERVCKDALSLERPDYEDGIVAACATLEHADAIVSRDAAAFNDAGVPKFTPAQLMKELGYERMDW